MHVCVYVCMYVCMYVYVYVYVYVRVYVCVYMYTYTHTHIYADALDNRPPFLYFLLFYMFQLYRTPPDATSTRHHALTATTHPHNPKQKGTQTRRDVRAIVREEAFLETNFLGEPAFCLETNFKQGKNKVMGNMLV